jgi:hypothetical protein
VGVDALAGIGVERTGSADDLGGALNPNPIIVLARGF